MIGVAVQREQQGIFRWEKFKNNNNKLGIILLEREESRMTLRILPF